MARYSYKEVLAATTPASNWSKFAVHPISDRLLWLVANRTNLHPNVLTVVALLLGFLSAGFYFRGDSTGIWAGAMVFYASFALDTIDGALARLTDQRSALGAWLDTVGDFLRSAVLATAFAVGTYRWTGDVRALYLGFAVMGTGLLYYHLAEATEKLAGQRPSRMAAEATLRVSWIRTLGLVPSPFSLVDFEAVYLIIFPILGYPLLGMIVASAGGALSRLLLIAVAFSRLKRGRRPE